MRNAEYRCIDEVKVIDGSLKSGIKLGFGFNSAALFLSLPHFALCFAGILTVADPGLANGGPRSSAAQKFFWSPLPRKIVLILNIKLSNSSHSERHFCSLATHCTSKNTAFVRQQQETVAVVELWACKPMQEVPSEKCKVPSLTL